MRLINRVFGAACLLLALGGSAIAQSGCSGQAGAGKFCGNSTGATGLPGFVTIPAGSLTPIGGGTVLGNPTGATAAPIATATPVLGIPGSILGALGLSGSTSGTVTIRPQATAGTPTLTLPSISGTFAVGASSPLVLSVTTGNLTCPTCVTSSGGGAISGTAPIAVSAAGVVSLNSPLQIANGGLGATSLTAGLPIIGNGASNPTQGTVTGAGSTEFATTTTGPFNIGNCAQWTASGKLDITAAPCGVGSNVSYAQDFIAGTDFTAGTTTSLTVSNTPLSTQSTSVYFDGVRQSADTWSLSVATVTFSAAIPTNTQVVEIASLTTTILPTWVTSIGGIRGDVLLGSGLSASGQTINGAIGENLLNNSSFGMTTSISLVMVSATPTLPVKIPIASFVTVGGSNTNAAGFVTTGSVGPNGVGGLTPGKLVAIMGPNHDNLSFTGTVTGGDTITATTAVFTQLQGDLLWITGGTNHSARTQFRVTATASGGGTILKVNGALANESSVTFTAVAIQGGYAIDQTVNGMPQVGNPFAGAFYYYPLQVSAIGGHVFNASMAGHYLSAGTTSTASAWEVTNGVQGTGLTVGPDWWQTSPTLSWYKMRGYDWDGTTIVNMPGELYSVKVCKGITGEEDFFYDLTSPIPTSGAGINDAGLAQFRGKTVTGGINIKSPNANQGRFYIDDGITKTYSPYVTPGSFQWTEITGAISSVATKAVVGFSTDTGSVGDCSIITQPMTVLGAGKIGAGNYKRGPMASKMAYGHVNPFYYIGRDVPVATFINIEQETMGLLPTGMQAIQTDVEAFNNSVLSYLLMSNSDVQQMTALTLYNQVTAGNVKNVNTMMLGVGRRLVQDGTNSFWQDTHYIGLGDSHFNLNIDYLGGIYQ